MKYEDMKGNEIVGVEDVREDDEFTVIKTIDLIFVKRHDGTECVIVPNEGDWEKILKIDDLNEIENWEDGKGNLVSIALTESITGEKADDGRPLQWFAYEEFPWGTSTYPTSSREEAIKKAEDLWNHLTRDEVKRIIVGVSRHPLNKDGTPDLNEEHSGENYIVSDKVKEEEEDE